MTKRTTNVETRGQEPTVNRYRDNRNKSPNDASIEGVKPAPLAEHRDLNATSTDLKNVQTKQKSTENKTQKTNSKKNTQNKAKQTSENSKKNTQNKAKQTSENQKKNTQNKISKRKFKIMSLYDMVLLLAITLLLLPSQVLGSFEFEDKLSVRKMLLKPDEMTEIKKKHNYSGKFRKKYKYATKRRYLDLFSQYMHLFEEDPMEETMLENAKKVADQLHKFVDSKSSTPETVNKVLFNESKDGFQRRMIQIKEQVTRRQYNFRNKHQPGDSIHYIGGNSSPRRIIRMPNMVSNTEPAVNASEPKEDKAVRAEFEKKQKLRKVEGIDIYQKVSDSYKRTNKKKLGKKGLKNAMKAKSRNRTQPPQGNIEADQSMRNAIKTLHGTKDPKKSAELVQLNKFSQRVANNAKFFVKLKTPYSRRGVDLPEGLEGAVMSYGALCGESQMKVRWKAKKGNKVLLDTFHNEDIKEYLKASTIKRGGKSNKDPWKDAKKELGL